MDDFEQLDYYQLLEIGRSASADEIKQAYRQQMRRYHPDRVAVATPDEQAYASRRALRINEAYQTLSDFNARTAYNRGLAARGLPAPRPQPMPAKHRDHQAELYDQARAHLDAGRTLQAAATLRELQRLNPFYRDSAALLAQLDAATARKPEPAAKPAPAPMPPPPAQPVPNSSRRSLLIGGVGGALLAVTGAAAWWLRRPIAAAPSSAAAHLVDAPTATPAAAPTLAPPAPTDLPPTATPTAAPTTPPAPTATPAPLAEEGRLLYAEQFYGDAWPTTSGGGWSVVAGDGAYTITADPGVGNIWAYRTSPAGADLLVGVDVAVRGGEAGLILRFSDANNYLAFFIDPAARRFRLEQHAAGQISTPLADTHRAILAGDQAVNRLAVRLEGDWVDLRVNGQPLAELLLDAPPASTRYGLVAIAADRPATARFSDLSLREVG